MQSPARVWATSKVPSGPVDGPDVWDGYRAAIVAQTVLVSMFQGGPAEVESMVLPQLYRSCRSGVSE